MSQVEKHSFHFGFLRVAQTELGFVGGILVTNSMGRPLEFQCTTPVRPNKTQEILYGPTLEPFLYSELIGKTLLERLNVKPSLVVIQQDSLLDLRLHIDMPVACIVAIDSKQAVLADQTRIQLGRQLLKFHPNFPDDHQLVAQQQSIIPDDAELGEPLDRVKDALQETMKSGAVA